jgi:CHAT domain-containing protein/tetratricopeptide (TPR) repeat protein
MRLFRWLTYIFWLTSINAFGYAQIDTSFAYQQAESYYNTEVPTAQTDSLALINYLKAIDEFSVDKSLKRAPLLLDSYEKAGIIHQIYGRNEPAVRMYQNAIHTAKKFFLSDSLLYRPYLYIGNAYYYLHNFDSSLTYLKKAEILLNQYSPAEADRLYNALGIIYYEAGNFEQSINYFSLALEILDSLGISDQQAIYSFTSNIASSLSILREYDSAAVTYKSLVPLGIELNTVYLNLGSLYINQNLPDSALYYLQKVKDSTYVERIRLLNSKGSAYLKTGKYQQAINQLKRVLDSTKDSTLVRRNQDIGTTYMLMGDASIKQNQLSEALRYYQRAIIQFDYDFSDTTVFSNPHDFASAFSSFALFGSLTAKAYCLELLYKQKKQPQYLLAAIDTYQAAFEMADYVNKWFDNEDARLFLAEEVLPSFQHAVDFAVVAYEQTEDVQYLETAFRWAEKSKANALAAAIREDAVRSYSGLPDSLLNQESLLQQNLSRLFLKIDQAEGAEAISSLETEIRNTELALSRLQDRLNEYPTYRQKKFQYDSLNIDFLQQEVLDSHSALLSYFLSDSTVYLFSLQTNRLSYRAVPRDSAYTQNLQQLQDELRNIQAGQTYQGIQPARYLYDQLLLPSQSVLNNAKALIIIPHQELNYLPFEVLLNANDEYLLRSHQISYQYTASFLKLSPVAVNDLGSALALAPFSANETYEPSGLEPLPSSVSEISRLSGVMLEHSEATKDNFLRYSKDVSIIHLATHAIADSEDPTRSYIAFYPYQEADSSYKLFAHELYNLPLQQTQLAFLSACETASGMMVNGEGIMSLSRAFAYAGCPNLITSQWKAEDHTTAYLSERFYGYLNQGSNVAEALRLAKLDLLDDEKFAQFQAPPYWAHLIFIGNPHSPTSSYAFLWVLGLLFLGILLITFGWIRCKKIIYSFLASIN